MAFEQITLKNGPTIPMAAYGLFMALDRRGFALRNDEGTLRLSGDPSLLSEDDRQEIKRLKLHLLEIVEYLGRGVVELPPK